MEKTQVLIISNKLDYTSDYICVELNKRGTKYLRLNRDEFYNYIIKFDILKNIMLIKIGGEIYQIDEGSLKSIYYRAPIYLRDIYQPDLSGEEQLYRTQWTAFIRNLTVFEDVIWVNNPEATFKAENKLLQLKYAQKEGFKCPTTFVSNCSQLPINDDYYIVKSLDTGLLRIDDKEAFIYSNKVPRHELANANLCLVPVIIQEYIEPKIDVRVTVIGNKIYPVKIMFNGQGIDGDWRMIKDKLEYIPIQLPDHINTACINVVRSLGLAFGGIDLLKQGDSYYFLEVNPTGEWSWLVPAAKLPIYEGICDYLEGKNEVY